ncbi:MAG: hypothetical protein ACXVP4_05120 [Bacteroidia bacterium]
MDQIGQYDQNVAFSIDKLKIGEKTKPMPMSGADGKEAYRILYLKNRTSPHVANLTDDYQSIQAAALSKKQQDVINSWIKRKVVDTYVHLSDEYKTCKFNNKWIN